MSMKTTRVAITGAFGVLGKQMVRAALQSGAQVAAIDFAPATEPDNNNLLHVGCVDLTDAKQAQSALTKASDYFGGIDALVNIAGGFCWETIADGSIDNWDKMFSINLRTAVNACQAAIPILTKQNSSSIVNIGANSAVFAGTGMGPYAASKAGVAKLTESLASEFKAKGLRVNAVLPSIIDTPANRKDMPDADFSSWVTPEELSNVINFLISPLASGVTGALIPVVGRV